MKIPGCTILAVNNNGNYFIGSNSDNPWEVNTEVHVVQGETLKFIGTRLIGENEDLPWSNMITRGVNEAGIAFTFAFVDCNKMDLQEGGVTFKQFGYDILGNLKSLEEVENYIESHNLNIHGNFIFADGTGNLILAEIHPLKRSYIRNPKKYVLRTNHYLNLPNSMEKYMIESNSEQRLLSGKNKLESFNLFNHPVNDLKSILSNHILEKEVSMWGTSTCNHGVDVGTVSSEIIDPRRKIIWYCYGPPCGKCESLSEPWGEYRPFRLRDYNEGKLTDILGNVYV